MELPDTLDVGGVKYVRADRIQERTVALERSFSVSELSDMTGFPKSTIYDNIRSGSLRAVMPNGTTKGMRVMGSWWEDFIERKSSA